VHVITPEEISVDLDDAVAEVACPEMIGRLVQILAVRDLIDIEDVRYLFPHSYIVEDLDKLA